MTITILFWIKFGIILIIAYTVLKYILIWLRKDRTEKIRKIKRGDIISDLLFIVFAVFILYFIQNNYQRTFNLVLSEKTQTFPEFTFEDLKSGKEFSAGEIKSEIKLINYWATWCGPCRKEMPDLQILHQNFTRDQLQIIAISDEDAGTIRQFLSDKPFDFITARITRSNALLDSINQRPVSILLNSDGKVLDMIVGSRGHSFFRKWVQQYLDKRDVHEKK